MTLLAKLLGWVTVWIIGVSIGWGWMLYFFGDWLFAHPWVMGLIATVNLWGLTFTLVRELRQPTPTKESV